MNYKFTLGAVAGIASLALAVPLIAQVSNAASSGASASAQQSTQTSIPTGTTQAATISQSAAEQTALAAHPGTLSEATRQDSHFGGYKVEVTGSDGKEYDVIVDASTGQITDSWIDGQGGPQGRPRRSGHAPAAGHAGQHDVQPLIRQQNHHRPFS